MKEKENERTSKGNLVLIFFLVYHLEWYHLTDRQTNQVTLVSVSRMLFFFLNSSGVYFSTVVSKNLIWGINIIKIKKNNCKMFINI